MKTILIFIAAMLAGILALSLLPGCQTRDITLFSLTNGSSLASDSKPRTLPRQMTWRDMVPSERGRK